MWVRTARSGHVDRLFRAIRKRDADCVRSLLDVGVDPDSRDRPPSRLLLALDRLSPIKVQRIERGLHKTALMAAVEADTANIVRLLIERGANVNLVIEHGWSAAGWAIQLHRFEILRVLLEGGTNPNLRHYEGDTLLHYTDSDASSEAVRILLEFQADPNLAREDGQTPLHEAAQFAHLELAELLLKGGSEVNKRDKEGLTPLGIVRKQRELWQSRGIAAGDDRMQALLLAWGAEE